MLTVPVAVFAATFLPFLREGAAGIIQNVLLYRGYDNAPLWKLLLPSGVLAVVSPTMLFLAVLAVSGLLLHHRNRVDSLLIYQIVLVAFSPAVANQSLAIPAAAMAVFPNALFGVFVAMASVHLLIHHEGLNIEAVQWVGASRCGRIHGTGPGTSRRARLDALRRAAAESRGSPLSASPRQRHDVEEHREEVEDAAGQHEAVPNRVVPTRLDVVRKLRRYGCYLRRRSETAITAMPPSRP